MEKYKFAGGDIRSNFCSTFEIWDIPQTSNLHPQTSNLHPQTSNLRPQTSNHSA